MADTGKLSWTDWRGREVSREVRYTLDIRDFKRTPGFPLLLLAANPHLSMSEIERLLDCYVRETRNEKIRRGLKWLYSRRWLFLEPHISLSPGVKPNADGKGRRAVEIMRANPHESLISLCMILKRNGIRRGKEWVRQHRCD